MAPPVILGQPVTLSLIMATFSLIQLGAAYTWLPEPSPVECSDSGTGCTITNYQASWTDFKPCNASQALFPSSESDLFQAVALASKTNTKIKVLSTGSHSFPKLVCPGGDRGLLVSTQFLNSLIHVNTSSLTVTAHSGVTLRPLLDKIAQHGLALPHSPYWGGVSVGGMISTGAHGSGMWGKGSAIHDYVVGMRIIVPATQEEGYAKIIDLNEEDEDLNAAKLSLGVLGAISQVTFQLVPMFKRSATWELRGDESLEDDVLKFSKLHEFGKVKWYPGNKKALFKLDDRISMDTKGDGMLTLGFKKDVHVIEELKENYEVLGQSHDVEKVCLEEAMMINDSLSSGDDLRNFENIFTEYPVVGFNHKMQADEGFEIKQLNYYSLSNKKTIKTLINSDDNLISFMWNPLVNGPRGYDTSIAIPILNFRDAIAEIKKLRDMHPKAICCVSYGSGILMRFLTKSKAYLGMSTDCIVIEVEYYRAKDHPSYWMNQDLFDELEQMLVYKFGGRPHWGKNRNAIFEPMRSKIATMERFLKVRQRFDPSGLFSNEWTNAILGIGSLSQGVQAFQDHCALNGLCICKEDIHCDPANGYFCRAGFVYKEARVCRYEEQDSSIERILVS